MGLSLKEMLSIARGDVTGVTALLPTNVTPEKPQVNASNVSNASKRLGEEPAERRLQDGVTEGITALPRLLFNLERLQIEADLRNRKASEAWLTSRWCSCGKLATVAVGRFKESPANREGVARWFCTECFPLAGNVTHQSEP
jgi:hypothetical protein